MIGLSPNKKQHMWKAINQKVVASREKLTQQTPKKPQASVYVLRGSTKTAFCISTQRESGLQEVGIGNRLECSNLFTHLMSLECVCVCVQMCLCLRIILTTSLCIFWEKCFGLRGLISQNFLLLISPLHLSSTLIKCFSS